MAQEYLTIEQVAEYLHVPKTTLYKYTSKNTSKSRLPGARVGKKLRFRRSDVDQWFEKLVDKQSAQGELTNQEAMADNSLSEVLQKMLRESVDVLSAAANTFEDLKTRFGGALMDELNERLQRLKQGKSPEDFDESLGSTSSFVGLRVPNSVMDQVNAQVEAEDTTKSEFVRDSLSLRLRMAGLSGEALAKEINKMLDEAMGRRIASLVSSVVVALGPDAAAKFAELTGALLFFMVACTSESTFAGIYPVDMEKMKVIMEKARVKAAEFVAELAAQHEKYNSWDSTKGKTDEASLR